MGVSNYTIMKTLSGLIIFLTLSRVQAQECPAVSSLVEDNNVPEIAQVDSETILVDWTHLWPNMEWYECVANVTININNETMVSVDDIEDKSEEVMVTPCEEIRVAIQIVLNQTGEMLSSFVTRGGFETFKSPKIKDGFNLTVDYLTDPMTGLINLTAVDVFLNYMDLVDEPGCRKVKETKLMYRKTTAADESDWTVVKSLEIFQTMEETISGLNDLCSGYEFAVELVGTEGTSSTRESVAKLAPVSDELMMAAYHSGFQMHQLSPPGVIELTSSTSSSLSFQWDHAPCWSRYRVSLKITDDEDDVELVQEVQNNSITFDNLAACSKYTAKVRALKEFSEELKFDSPPSVMMASTSTGSAGKSDSLNLTSFRSFTGQTYAIVSWLANEVACLGELKATLCNTSEDGKQCEDADSSSRKDGRVLATFNKLMPCTLYEVSVSPKETDSPEYQFVDDESTSDFDTGSMNAETGLAFKSVISTRVIDRKPRNLTVTNVNFTNVTLNWISENCAPAYTISLNLKSVGAPSMSGSRTVHQEDMKIVPLPYELYDKVNSNFGNEDDFDGDDEDAVGSGSGFETEVELGSGEDLNDDGDRLIKKRSPEFTEIELDNFDYESEMKAIEEGSLEAYLKSSEMSDDEDYVDFGSGNFEMEVEVYEDQEILKNLPLFQVSAMVDGLKPCTEYEFQVQNHFEGQKKIFGQKESVSAKTMCPVDSTKNLKINQEVSDDGKAVKLMVHWQQMKQTTTKISVKLVRNDSILFHESINTDGAVEEFEDVSKSFEIDFCSKYEVTLEQDFDENFIDNKKKEIIISKPNPNGSLSLTGFYIDISMKRGRGTAIAKWIHDLECVEKYKFELYDQTYFGEKSIYSPSSLGDRIQTDLHLVPGMLSLLNCENYTINVSPVAYNGYDWKATFERNFTYQTTPDKAAPNYITPTESFVLVPGRASIRMSMKQRFTCNNITLTARGIRHLRHQRQEEPQQSIEAVIPPELKEFTLTDLQPCVTYEVTVGELDSEEIYHKTTVKTERDAEHRTSKLNENEVIAWKEEEKTGIIDIQLEWSDRCSSKYFINICKQLCDLNEVDDHIEVPIASKEEKNPTFVLTGQHLEPCSEYLFSILDHNRTRLYQGNFTTIFNSNFTFNPKFSLDENQLTASWKGIFPCISSYNASIDGFNVSTVLINEESGRMYIDIQESFDVLEDTVLPCSTQTLLLKPSLSDPNEKWEASNLYRHEFTYFTKPHPPSDLTVLDIDPNEAQVEWSHLDCYNGYEIEVRNKDNELVLSETKTEPKIFLFDLNPCTQYTVGVWSLSGEDGEKSENSTVKHFMTSHADVVDIESKIDYESLTFDATLHGTDCIDHYVFYLCDMDGENFCWNKTVGSDGAIDFKYLTEGSEYFHQMIGYNSDGAEVFATEKVQIETKTRIKAALLLIDSGFDYLQFKINSSAFWDDTLNEISGKDLLPWSAEVTCESNGDYQEVQKMNNINETVTFTNLKPVSKYICYGKFKYGKEVANLAKEEFKTVAGIPDAPLFPSGKLTNSTVLALDWQKPIKSNGVIKEYQIVVLPDCQHIDLDMCPKYCPDNETFFSDTNSYELQLEPYVNYTILLAARTEHPKFGPFSNPYRIRTDSVRPKPPVIVEIFATELARVMLKFEYPCPLTGPTNFSVVHSCDKCQFKSKATVHRRSMFKFEILDLEGGHYHDVSVTASVVNLDNNEVVSVPSESKVVFVPCDFQCRDGSCVNNRKKNVTCDFIRDCSDGSDEADCPCDPPLKFQCTNKYCIPASRRCDGVNDCNDMSDERGCSECKIDEFKCQVSGECIPKNQTCDRRINCRDGTDENLCAYWSSTCWPDRFRCLDHTCVDIKHRCDGIWDCMGGEDEFSCNVVCKEGHQFGCRNQECIDMNKYCDGIKDCSDGSDELFECKCHIIGQFSCKSQNQCIPRLKVCDGEFDCKDGSDEIMCGRKISHTKKKPTNTKDPVNIVNKIIVDSEKDSNEDKDQKSEEETATTTLATPLSTTALPTTIPTARSVQTTSSSTTTSSTQPSTSTTTDVKKNDANGEEDFIEYDDVMMYNEIRPVEQESFYDDELQSANQIKESYLKSKEAVARQNSPYKVRVYPDSQWVHVGDDVVIQCRDEGYLRAPVSFRRKDGRPLPETAELDMRGRLMLVNVSPSDAGVYECFVLDVKTNVRDGTQTDSAVMVRQRPGYRRSRYN